MVNKDSLAGSQFDRQFTCRVNCALLHLPHLYTGGKSGNPEKSRKI